MTATPACRACGAKGQIEARLARRARPEWDDEADRRTLECPVKRTKFFKIVVVVVGSEFSRIVVVDGIGELALVVRSFDKLRINSTRGVSRAAHHEGFGRLAAC